MLTRLFSRLTAPLSLFVLVLLTLSPSQASPSPRGIPFFSRPDWSPTFIGGAAGGVTINEVMYYPDSGQSEWVELRNGGPGAANLRGYQLSDEDGNVYFIPASLPDVPAGAFVVVIFDGAGGGADDYSFSDNVAMLHSPAALTNIFEDDADQIALYSTGGNLGNAVSLPFVQRNAYTWNPPVPGIPADPVASPMLSYVAWGAPAGEDGAEAERAGLWNRDWYVSPYRGLGDESEEVELGPNESLGLLPNSTSSYPEDWTIFHVGYVTPGAVNALPPIDWYYPPANATVDSATFSIIWAPIENATGYRFQLDDSSAFDSPHADTVLTTAFYRPSEGVPEGTYYWRVKVLFSQGESPWSSPLAVNSMALPDPTTRDANGLPVVTSKVLGITWQLQHKDTNMLCLQGDPPTGADAWNVPHATRGNHENNYCVRASISMMASYYGGRLSQDRITYEIFKAQKIEAQLGHNIGVLAPPNPVQSNTLSWALGTNVPVTAGKPTFAQFKTWIDAGSPIMSRIPGHMRVIDGYMEFTTLGVTFEFLHLLDPWDGAKWVSYDSDDIRHVYVGPAGTNGAPSVRSDEDADGDAIPDTMDDSDGDGVTDFDELHRFNLNPGNPDSDSDFVRDAQDIYEYVFADTGVYDLVSADIDADGDRKELDPDNDYSDDEGTLDGCEDENWNGIYDIPLGETSNFKASDDITLHVRLDWPQVGSDVDLHLIRPGGSYGGAGDAHWANTNPDWGEAGLTCDDPRLDVDCISSCTVENIRLPSMENGTYTIKVHFYDDHDDESERSTTATVTVSLAGVQTTYTATITDKQIWDVATIQWPPALVTETNLITDGPPATDGGSLPMK